MSEKISRRQFAAKAVAVGGAAALGVAGLAQSERKPAEADLQAAADLESLESKLEKPLPAKLRPLAKTALKNARNASKERLKYRLPEGSEPCTTFIPLPPRSSE